MTHSRALKKGNVLSEEELETLIELSAEEGALHETESEMIQEILKLGDKTARDCMTPRVDAFAVPDDLPRGTDPETPGRGTAACRCMGDAGRCPRDSGCPGVSPP